MKKKMLIPYGWYHVCTMDGKYYGWMSGTTGYPI